VIILDIKAQSICTNTTNIITPLYSGCQFVNHYVMFNETLNLAVDSLLAHKLLIKPVTSSCLNTVCPSCGLSGGQGAHQSHQALKGWFRSSWWGTGENVPVISCP